MRGKHSHTQTPTHLHVHHDKLITVSVPPYYIVGADSDYYDMHMHCLSIFVTLYDPHSIGSPFPFQRGKEIQWNIDLTEQ